VKRMAKSTSAFLLSLRRLSRRTAKATKAVAAVNDYWVDDLGFTVLRAPTAIVNIASGRI
jgi:hypothetical protein